MRRQIYRDLDKHGITLTLTLTFTGRIKSAEQQRNMIRSLRGPIWSRFTTISTHPSAHITYMQLKGTHRLYLNMERPIALQLYRVIVSAETTMNAENRWNTSGGRGSAPNPAMGAYNTPQAPWSHPLPRTPSPFSDQNNSGRGSARGLIGRWLQDTPAVSQSAALKHC